MKGRAASAEGGNSVADLNDQDVAVEGSAEGSAVGLLLEERAAGSSKGSQVGRRPGQREEVPWKSQQWLDAVAPGRPQATEPRSEDIYFRMEERPVI